MAIQLTGLQLRRGDGPQLLLEFDAAFSADATVDSVGNLTFNAPAADISVVSNTFAVVAGVDEDAKMILVGLGAATQNEIDSNLDLSIKRGSVQQFKVIDDGITFGATGTTKVKEGVVPEIVEFAGQGIASLIRMTSDVAANKTIQFQMEPDGLNSTIIQLKQDNATGEFLFTAFDSGVPTLPFNGWKFSITPVFFDIAAVFQAGGVGAPVIYFDGFPQTGLYRAASDDMSVTANGTQIMSWTDGRVFFSKQMRGPDSLTVQSAYSFTASNASGMGWDDVNLRLTLANTGTVALGIDQTNGGRVLNFYPVLGPDGSTALPAFAFINAPDRGMGKTSTDLVFVLDGILRQIVRQDGVMLLSNPTTDEVLRLESKKAASLPFISFYDDLAARKGFIQSAGPTMIVNTDDVAGAVQLRVGGVSKFNVANTLATSEVQLSAPSYVIPSANLLLRRDDGLSGAAGWALAATTGNVGLRLIPSGSNAASLIFNNASDGANYGSFTVQVNGSNAQFNLTNSGVPALPVNVYRFQIESVEVLNLTQNQVWARRDGTAGSPALRVGLSENSGFYAELDALNVTVAGSRRFRFSVGNTLAYSTLTASQDGTLNLGSSDVRWANVFCDNLTVTNPPWASGTFPTLVGTGVGTTISESYASDQAEILNVSVPGAVTTDTVMVSWGINGSGGNSFMITGYVSGTDNVRITITNTNALTSSMSARAINIMVLR